VAGHYQYGVVSGIGKSEAGKYAEVGAYFDTKAKYIKANATKKEEVEGLGQPQFKGFTNDAEGCFGPIINNIVGRHTAKHAAYPQGKFTVLFFIYIALVAHTLHSGNIALLQHHTAFECRLAKYYGNEQENNNGNSVREQAFQIDLLHQKVSVFVAAI
jgi:hypothetical protein